MLESVPLYRVHSFNERLSRGNNHGIRKIKAAGLFRSQNESCSEIQVTDRNGTEIDVDNPTGCLSCVFKAEGGTKDVKKGREPKNQVHQEAILVETIRKEMANQKLYTNYSVNPFKKSNCHRSSNGRRDLFDFSRRPDTETKCLSR